MLQFIWRGSVVIIVIICFLVIPKVHAGGEWEGAGIALGTLTFFDVFRDGRLDWPKVIFRDQRYHRQGNPGEFDDYYFESRSYWEGFYKEKARIEKRKRRDDYRRGQKDARRSAGGWY